MSFVETLLAYILVDALIGIYHWFTDNGYNTKSMNEKFLAHHIDPLNMESFDWQPMPWGLMILCLGVWVEISFVIAFGSFLMLAQIPHYYAHRRSKNQTLHRIIRAMQKMRLIASPESHSIHHDGIFNRNFCVLSGWNNFWLNRLLND